MADYKVCKKCKENKELKEENFSIRTYPSGKSYFRSPCKKCNVKYAIAYNLSYKKSNEQKNKFAIYKKMWKEKNRLRANQEYVKKRKSDIAFRLRKNISTAIGRMLKIQNKKKEASVLKYLKYSPNELKIHLENKFDINMSWANYGIYWHIDHIIPQSCLLYISMEDENFKKCWALENLRPLEAKQNMLDGCTRIRHKIFNGEI